jgi:hypothetical protein
LDLARSRKVRGLFFTFFEDGVRMAAAGVVEAIKGMAAGASRIPTVLPSFLFGASRCRMLRWRQVRRWR